MGYGMDYKCPNCGHSVSYFLGFGMLYPDFKKTCEILSELDDLINKEELDKILSSKSFIHESDKDNYENPEYLFEHVLSVDLYECSDCEKYYPRNFFRIRSKDGEIFVPRYSCEECGRELHFKKDDVFKCPKCGEIMDFIGEILWD